jgi:glyoxylase-like metal-dependent hydrolase (beta-lactamase superfamily II)
MLTYIGFQDACLGAMDKIPIPEEDVVSFNDTGPDITGLRVLIVNVYAISRTPTDWILIDSGLPYFHTRIRHWAEENVGGGTRPRYILLTHAHFDHAGSAQALAAEWDVPVYVHPLEAPHVTGESEYPQPDPTVGGGLMALISRMYPRGPVNLGSRVKLLPQDGSVPDFPEWRWIHTPGHTDGHISLFRDADRVLIAGDAFVTTKQESFLAVAMQTPELHGPPAYFTTDWDAARDSVRRLAELRPARVGTGHGKPLAGPHVGDALDRLAGDFDRVARPKNH